MRTILFLLLLATPAVAQPVTAPSSCEVTISRAPDDVRQAIEKWVRAEPRCATTLDVRVIPTDGGLYLFARDGAGRIRERIVPDAQSAGVLVASWAADDGIPPPSTTPPPVAPTPSEPAPDPTPAVAPPSDPRLAPPGAFAPPGAAPIAPPVDGAPRPPSRAGRWLTLGGMFQPGSHGGAGLRADIDLHRRGKWTFGAILAASTQSMPIEDGFSGGTMDTVDVRALGYVARTSSFRHWDLRVSLGAGVMSTSASGNLGADRLEARGTFPTAEVSLLLARELRPGWAIAVGPVATWFAQSFQLRYPDGGMSTLDRRAVEVMAFGGLRYRL